MSRCDLKTGSSRSAERKTSFRSVPHQLQDCRFYRSVAFVLSVAIGTLISAFAQVSLPSTSYQSPAPNGVYAAQSSLSGSVPDAHLTPGVLPLSFPDAIRRCLNHNLCVVLAVGNSYLQALAGAARVETAEAQVRTAQALYDKAADQQKAGVAPAIDSLRARVELQARQQQFIVARNDYAKQKLALSRVIGLPLGQQFDLTDKIPYEPLSAPDLDESLRRAYSSRSDYQAALAQFRGAELARKAAAAGYFPSLDMEADYGDIGINPATSNGTFHLAGTLTIPVFQGGRVHADVLQSEATLRLQRSQTEVLRRRLCN